MFESLKRKESLTESTLYSVFQAISLKPINESTKILELAESFHENGIMINMIIFSLPLAMPVPYPPGLAILISIFLMILALQAILGYRRVWLPARLLQYEIHNKYLIAFSKKALLVISLARKIVKPKFLFVKSSYCKQLIGFIAFINSIIIMVPIPFGNFLPALGITMMSLGVLNKNGFIIIVGIFMSILGLVIAIGLVFTSFTVLLALLSQTVHL